MTFKTTIGWIFVLSYMGLLTACGAYSFTGASIPPDVETISIDYFDNASGSGPPTLSQQFTEALKDRFISQTQLTLVEKKGDLQLKGKIVKYEVTAASPKGKDAASLNRLTIEVRANYKNVKHPDDSWEQRFSRYEDFPSGESLSAVEDRLIQDINEQLVTDIFNKAVVNW